MTTLRMLLVLVLLSILSLTRADYECLCNYNVETPVLDGSSESSNNIGTLYEFDCKPVVHVGEVDRKQWAIIAYEHQQGYVKLNSGLKIQTCPGNPDENDLVTTKFPPTTTTTVPTSAKITTKMTETSSRSTKPTTVITETSSPSSTPTTSTTVSSTTEQQTTPRSTSTPRPTTISTTTPSTTSTSSTTLSTQELTITTPPTSTIVSTTSTQQPTTSTTQRTSTVKPTTTTTKTTSTQQPTTTKTTTTTSTSPVTYTSTTQSSTTTARSSTIKTMPFGPAPFSIGNTMLCPASVRQHASQKHGILAQHGGSCYNIERHSVSWLHAESTCKQYGGHLLHINSAAENYFIYRLLDTKYNHTVWTGLHDRGHEEQFTWTSGSPVNYTNWYPNRKSNFMNHHDEDCVVFVPYLHHGQWDDVHCGINDLFAESLFETHPFICQYAVNSMQPAVLTTTTTIQPPQHTSGNINLCPTNRRILGITSYLAQYGNSCYEWFTSRASWRHAETNCVTHGGHLVQIKDANEENFVQWFLNTHDSQHAIWIGLYDLGHEEKFKWTSGDPVSYTNWIPGRKSNFVSHTVEDCVAYIPYKQGQWDDIPCGSSGGLFGDSGETHPYMCEYKIQSGTSSILGGLIG